MMIKGVRRVAILLVGLGLSGACVIRPDEVKKAPALPSPIRAHPHDPRYLEYQDKPLVLITSGEPYGAVLNADFDYGKYLDTLQADGLNYTRIFTGAYVEHQTSFGVLKCNLAPAPGRFVAPWGRSSEPGYARGGNKFDLGKWDDQYFDRLKDFLRQASERGIIVELTFFSSYYTPDHWKISPLHPANNVSGTPQLDYREVNTLDNSGLLGFQEELVRKLVRELNSFDNLIYEIQNEPWADQPQTTLILNPYLPDWSKDWQNRVDLASKSSLAWQRRMVDVLVEEESKLPKQHMIAQNFCNFRFPLKDVDERISILNFHYAYPEAVTWNYGWKRVLSFDESGFSGPDDEVYRRQAWRFILAGGGVFNNLDYSFYPGAEDGTGVNQAPGGGSPSLRRQLKVLKDFIHGFDFVSMGPDRSVIRRAPGTVVQVLAARGRAYAIYLEAAQGPGEYEVTLSTWGGNPLVAEWISPRDGRIEKREVIDESGEVNLKSPPFEVDIALRILPEDRD